MTAALALEADEVGRYGLVYVGAEPPALEGMVRFLPYDTMDIRRTGKGITLTVLSAKELGFRDSQTLIGFARALCQIGDVQSRF